MKYKTTINDNIDERIEIYVKNRTDLVNQIEELCDNDELNIIGTLNSETYPLNINDIEIIYIQDEKTYVEINRKQYQIKYRLYQLEEKLKESFIKINQSVLINKKFIKCFKSSWGGSILVELTSGRDEYVSRRQTKIVMERMGIK